MLSEKIDSDYILAYKAKDMEKVTVLRLLKTAIKNMQIELMRPLSNEEVLTVIIKQAKQRKDSITQFEEAKRQDLANKEEKELLILENYLPTQLTEEELKKNIRIIVEKIDAKNLSDIGKIMTELNTSFQGQIDGKLASSLVKEILKN